MAGGVHAGSQLRWHEALCRIQVDKLRDITAESGGGAFGLDDFRRMAESTPSGGRAPVCC